MGIPECVARTRSGSPAAVARWSLAQGSDSRRSHRAQGWFSRRSGQWAPPKDTGTRNFPRFDATRRFSAKPIPVSQVARSTPAGGPAPGLRTPRIAQPRTRRHAADEAQPRRASAMSEWLPPRDGKPDHHQPHRRARPAPKAGVRPGVVTHALANPRRRSSSANPTCGKGRDTPHGPEQGRNGEQTTTRNRR